MKQIKGETGLTVIMFDIDAGTPREIGNGKRPVYVPQDLEGLKMRTTGSPVEVALYRAWSAGPVPVAWSETYTALQQGVVDGHYNQPIHTYFTGKFQEVIKYYTLIGQSWVTSVKVLSPAAEKKLGPEFYKVLLEAGKDAEVYKDKLTAAKTAEAMKGLEDAGVQIIRPTESQMKLWVEKSRSIWPEIVGKSVPKDLVDQIVAVGM